MTDDEDTWRNGRRPGSHWDDDRRATDGEAFRSRPPRPQHRPNELPIVAQSAQPAPIDEITLPHDLFDEPRPEERARRPSEQPITELHLRRLARHLRAQADSVNETMIAEMRALLDRAPRDQAAKIEARLASLENSRDAVARKVSRAFNAALGSVALLVGGIYAYGRKAERFDQLERSVQELRVDIREIRDLTRRSAVDRPNPAKLADAGAK